MMQCYFSENWEQATEKFYKNASNAGELKWCVDNQHKFDIPYAIIGNGPNVVLMYSGINGIQGYYGSAAQNMFLEAWAPAFKPEFLKKFTFVLIHAINGWGMQNKMPETFDKSTGALVDINRNIGKKLTNKTKIPKNPVYNRAHKLLVSKPERVKKLAAIKRVSEKLRLKREDLFRGQYQHKNGLFFGGTHPARESLMTQRIMDNVMHGAQSLTAIHFTTGPGLTSVHKPISTSFDTYSFGDINKIQHIASLTGGFSATGVDDVVRYDAMPAFLESKYGGKMPVYSANLCIGTYKNPGTFGEFMLLHMGNAHWELENRGQISPYTHKKLVGLWYNDTPLWKNMSMIATDGMYCALLNGLNRYYSHNR